MLNRETINSIQQMPHAGNRDHRPSVLAVDHRGIRVPVAFWPSVLRSIETTVDKHVLGKRNPFLVQASLHPHFPARCHNLVNRRLNRLFGKTPTRSVVRIIPVGRHAHHRTCQRPHCPVRLVRTNVHVLPLDTRLAIDVQPRAAHRAVITCIHTGRVRLDVYLPVTHTSELRICGDVSFARRHAPVIVRRVPIKVVVPQRRMSGIVLHDSRRVERHDIVCNERVRTMPGVDRTAADLGTVGHDRVVHDRLGDFVARRPNRSTPCSGRIPRDHVVRNQRP